MIDTRLADVVAPLRVSVADLFGSEAHYVIPIYQRNYAWGEDQIRQLIDDIVDAAVEGAAEEYFLGNLVVSELGGGRFEVLDGQQRLTTLYLLLAFLRHKAPSPNRKLTPLAYKSRSRAQEALKLVALDPHAWFGGGGRPTSESDASIDEGIAEACRIIAQSPEAIQLREHASYFEEKVVLVRVTVPEDTDRNRYFEVMNTRGAQLAQVDIVKARLMSRLAVAPECAVFARVWAACADMDRYVQMSLTPGDTVLRGLLFGPEWSWLVPETFEALVQLLGSTEAETLHSRTLAEALEHYDRSATPASSDGDDQDDVRFEATITFPILLLHTLKARSTGEGGEDERQLDDKKLVARFASVTTPEDVRSFCLDLLRCRFLLDNCLLKREYRSGQDGEWSLRCLVRGTTQKVGYRRDIPRYLAAFPEFQQRISLLQQALRITYTSPRTMHWITEVLRRLLPLRQRPSGGELLETLDEYARDKVRQSFRGDAFFPSGFDVPRIVFTWLDYLLVKDKPESFQFTFRNSIEHFFPRHADKEMNGSHVGGGSIDRLGNLCLVSVRENSRFGNMLPDVKANTYPNTVKQSPKLQKMAERAGSWDDEAVRDHEEEMLALLRASIGFSGTRLQESG
jgi:hypothetical protein